MSEKKFVVVYQATLNSLTNVVFVKSATEETSLVTTQLFGEAKQYDYEEAQRIAKIYKHYLTLFHPATVYPAVMFQSPLASVDIDEEESSQHPDAVAMELRLEAVKLSVEEKAALQHLTNFWNAYLALQHPLDLSEFDPHAAVRNAVNAIQHAMAVRVAKRVDPDVWQ